MQSEIQEQGNQPQVDTEKEQSSATAPITYNKAYFLAEYKVRHKLHIKRRLEDALEMGELFALANAKLEPKEFRAFVTESEYGKSTAYYDMELAWNKEKIETIQIEHNVQFSLTVWYELIKAKKDDLTEWIVAGLLTSDCKVKHAKKLMKAINDRNQEIDKDKGAKKAGGGSASTAGVKGGKGERPEPPETVRINDPEFLEFRNRPENLGLSNAQVGEKFRNRKEANKRAEEEEHMHGHDIGNPDKPQTDAAGAQSEEKWVPNARTHSTIIAVDGKVVVQMFVPATMADAPYVEKLFEALEACIKDNSNQATTELELQFEVYPWRVPATKTTTE
jgi:hypothetical protein